MSLLMFLVDVSVDNPMELLPLAFPALILNPSTNISPVQCLWWVFHHFWNDFQTQTRCLFWVPFHLLLQKKNIVPQEKKTSVSELKRFELKLQKCSAPILFWCFSWIDSLFWIKLTQVLLFFVMLLVDRWVIPNKMKMNWFVTINAASLRFTVLMILSQLSWSCGVVVVMLLCWFPFVATCDICKICRRKSECTKFVDCNPQIL